MRNLRFRSAASAATTALVAALALTACGQGDADGAAQKPDTQTVASTSTPKDDSTSKPAGATDKPQDSTDRNAQTAGNNSSNNNSGGNKSADKSGDSSNTSDARTTCTGKNTKVTVTDVTRPINHLLVTATNTGKTNCDAYYAPLLGFDEAQAVTQINENSKPQAVVTLAPGESAYASISLGGDGSPDIAAYKLSVNFAGRSNQGSVGSPANLTLPKGTMVSDTTSVSYWQSTMADALIW
ncbi:DUF4232 domain-containing protein [Streptomyces sp. NPDC006645]|uniref:DUF4232 domain-containing protein n=1 Tax=unclassified Streptomyces TaxID=2593676 RepID=UPI0033BAEA7D